MIEDTIYTLLSAVGTVAPVMKQGQEVPYMVYSIISNNPASRKANTSATDVLRLQVDIVSNTAKGCGTLYESLRTALDNYKSGVIQRIYYDNHYDSFDEPSEFFIRSVDFFIRYNR